jgi:hypothetical protein
MKTRILLGVKINYRCGRGEIYDGRGMERKEGEEGRQKWEWINLEGKKKVFTFQLV